MKLTLTEALVKLKLYDKKIEKKYQILSIGKIIDIQKGKSNKLLYSDLEITNFKNEAKSYIDSIKQLIKNRATLKSKILEANAKTKVTIANTEYKLINPLNLEKIIDELNREIEEFESEVDVKLSIANSNTFIEI